MFSVKNEWKVQEKHECLIIGVSTKISFEKGLLNEINEALQGQVAQLWKDGDISTDKKVVSSIYTLGQSGTKRMIFVGLGEWESLTFEDLKEVFGKTFSYVENAKIQTVTVYLDSFIGKYLKVTEAAHAMSEAFELATYKIEGYKQKSNESENKVEAITVLTSADREEVTASSAVGSVFGIGTNSARTLVNLPSNKLTATNLANYAIGLAEKYGFESEILEKEEMEQLGMGALLAVNQGSVEPPKMIVLKYKGKKDWKNVIGLIGKGITFDTGGYSLKPSNSIVGMKSDMGGAASVLGAMEIIGELRPEQNVIAVIPSTDNTVSGSAFKPDDVITAMNGKTIEVLNTDAEGRLVLADAITYAKQNGANYLVDVATLTGGVIVALGTEMTGVMTNNESLLGKVIEASVEVGEPMWRLPITEKDKKHVRNSKIADLNNSPSGAGHAIMGGAFIGEFAEETPWVHLDIAGTVTTKKQGDLGPEGATGVMARTLARLVEKFEVL